MVSWDDMVLVGWIARPHGNKGHVVVVPATDFIEARFAPGSDVRCRRKGVVETLTITACREHDGRAIVGFTGVESINDAETFRGCELRVPDDALPSLEPGKFWRHDLVGCVVVTLAGAEVGPVVRVDDGGGAPLLVVGPGEVLVPLNDLICKTVDVAAKRIVIDPIDGLLDLNAPGSAKAKKGGSE
jgi:16S rRNA processing protein RimM